MDLSGLGPTAIAVGVAIFAGVSMSFFMIYHVIIANHVNEEDEGV